MWKLWIIELFLCDNGNFIVWAIREGWKSGGIPVDMIRITENVMAVWAQNWAFSEPCCEKTVVVENFGRKNVEKGKILSTNVLWTFTKACSFSTGVRTESIGMEGSFFGISVVFSFLRRNFWNIAQKFRGESCGKPYLFHTLFHSLWKSPRKSGKRLGKTVDFLWKWGRFSPRRISCSWSLWPFPQSLSDTHCSAPSAFPP